MFGLAVADVDGGVVRNGPLGHSDEDGKVRPGFDRVSELVRRGVVCIAAHCHCVSWPRAELGTGFPAL